MDCEATMSQGNILLRRTYLQVCIHVIILAIPRSICLLNKRQEENKQINSNYNIEYILQFLPPLLLLLLQHTCRVNPPAPTHGSIHRPAESELSAHSRGLEGGIGWLVR